MQKSILLICLILSSITVGALFAQKAPPDRVVFQAKIGNITFQHADHVRHARGDCKACHDSLFPRDSSAPLNFKAALHKTAESGKTSCGGCHNPSGPSFATAGNCGNCHVK